MNSSVTSPSKTSGSKLAIQHVWSLIGIVVLTVFYVALFLTRAGNEGLFIYPLAAIPVILAGWFYGAYFGILTGVIVIILNAVLVTIAADQGWTSWVRDSWPVSLMVILVGYIAGRFHQAYERQLSTQAQLRSRERYVTLINLAIGDILSFKNLEDKYHFVITHLVNLFTADYAYLTRWDVDQEQASLVTTTKPAEQPFSGLVLSADESALIATVLHARQPLAIEDLAKSNYAISPLFMENSAKPAGSLFCIPLTAGDFKFGAVIIVYSLAHHFSPDEIQYGEMAGNQLGLALWVVQQELKIQKQLKEAGTLSRIEHVLSETERVGIETVLQLIVESARELIPGAENATLHLLDDENQVLIPRAVTGTTSQTKTALKMHPGEGVAGRVIATGEIVAVPDIRTSALFLHQTTPVQYRSLVVVPIQTNKRRVGTLSIHSSRVNAFTPDDCRLLGDLGTQAAIAIENANLLETTKQDLKEIDALYRLSQNLAASLDPDQIMEDVVDLLWKYFGYYHIQIYQPDLQNGGYLSHYAAGVIGNRLREQNFHLPTGTGIVGHVAETGEPFVTNDVDHVIFFSRNPLLPDTQSELAVPIKVEKQVVGVLDIQQTPPNRLTPRDIQLMTAVADQLAVILQKANLYSNLQASLRQEKATRSQLIQSERLAVVGRLLASVSHELGNPLQALQNALFLLKEEKGISPQGRQDLQTILEETERMAAMIDRLRSAYRPTQAEDFHLVQINDIIRDVQALTATLMRHKGIRFEFQPDPDISGVPGIPDQIRQVVLNLFMNAVDAMQEGGRLSVCTRQIPGQDKVLVSVADTGPGIEADILPHIFEPFVTNKEGGTGLGLTITYDIIRQHQGEIQAENNPEGGATFKVWLPGMPKDRS